METADFAGASASGHSVGGYAERVEKSVRVLVVEDDASMAAGIVRGLRLGGFDVALATNGADGAKRALAEEHDVMVLDLLLPEQNGFAVLEQLQGRTTMPILVLTARTELADRLRCFGLGAADFIAKPFFVEELVARIKSRLRIRDTQPKRIVKWGDAVVDLDARTLSVGGAPVALTRHELDILAYLVERPGRAIARQTLAELAVTEERDARTVDTHIARVRKKLGAAASSLVTVWGIGYRFELPEETP